MEEGRYGHINPVKELTEGRRDLGKESSEQKLKARR